MIENGAVLGQRAVSEKTNEMFFDPIDNGIIVVYGFMIVTPFATLVTILICKTKARVKGGEYK